MTNKNSEHQGPNATARGKLPVRTNPTIHDVAHAAGVSIGTVSKALNKTGSLKTETRERVIAAAKKLGFRPNDLAQALHRGKSFTVGLISNDNFGRFTMPILEGLEARLAEQKIAVFMCNATDDPAHEDQHLEQLLGKRVDGLVITSRRSDLRPELDLGGLDLPVIYVFAQSDSPNALSLLPDDVGGARLATEHLVAQGRKRIAHITGSERFEAVQLRRDGYRAVLKEAGLEAYSDYYQPGDWSEKWGRDAVRKLFAPGCTPPDALFCGNDQIARGAADELRESGIEVPDDVAIVGFDNWDVMTLAARPPLTSIDMNLRDLGYQTGEFLIKMIGGENFNGVHRLDCTLQVRESCGASKHQPAPDGVDNEE